MLTYTCPCCGYKTLESAGEYDICPICYWEDDPYQKEHVYEDAGANKVSLIKAQRNYEAFGACERHVIPYARKPAKQDEKDVDWKPVRDIWYEVRLICDDFKENVITIKQLEEQLALCDTPENLESILDNGRQDVEMIRFCTSVSQQREEVIPVLDQLLTELHKCITEKG